MLFVSFDRPTTRHPSKTKAYLSRFLRIADQEDVIRPERIETGSARLNIGFWTILGLVLAWFWVQLVGFSSGFKFRLRE